jgi:hypothetical protein
MRAAALAASSPETPRLIITTSMPLSAFSSIASISSV